MVQSSQRSSSSKAATASADRFLDAVSRELREPLGGVMAVAGLLQRQVSGDGQAYVRMIIEHTEAMMRTIESAKDLIQAENGVLSLDPQPASLRELMDALQAHWQPRAEEAGVTLLVSYDGEDLNAIIDAARIRQVFDHLVEHALRLTRRGGVEVSMKARRSADGVIIDGSVRDSGEGLAPEKLARIFEVSTDAADGDAGLGLALSRRLVEGMHGSIRAESNIGAGSTTAFGLVVQEAEEAQAEADDHGSLRNAHVLVVDDNATNRMVAEALCEMFDCTSESAEDGVEAVEAATARRFDLILMDIKMPRMDGVEATKAIRALPGPAGQVPIIALTANADPEDAKGYIASGMSCVVEKPIKAEALLQAMTSCLAGRERESRAAAAA